MLLSDTTISSTVRSMKIGMQGGFYPVPKDVGEDHTAEWLLHRSAELGCTVLQARHLPQDRALLEALGKLSESLGIELETSVPGVFQLAGVGADHEAKTQFMKAIENAKLMNMPVVRTGYGRLKITSSRYNRSLSIHDHIESLLPSLKEAAAIAKDADILLAVENHCDFTGREMAHLFDKVDSPHVGAALDTANGFTVFCDPNEDIEALAPYAFTTHMKDMVVVDSPIRGYIPFTAFGCAFGEGHVDLPRAVQLLAERSPRSHGLHLIIEPGWMRWDPERDVSLQEAEFYAQSVAYLKDIQNQSGRG
ncbi:sugar phosphate isomerase/epimerase [Paenibacillus sp. 1_12]|uniref:sugar phosphate isomerase/epimerase family protein n=1 Tax=Paenibacillus sp. 1_12 TaxID=1566278 RepID=UPI00210AA2BD|nr:sugar phosphate isomerase/epimerase [Paenibacillus sp. 1_12]